MLDFCAEKGIGPDIQVIDIADINTAYKRVVDGDVRYRYVIDHCDASVDRQSRLSWTARAVALRKLRLWV